MKVRVIILMMVLLLSIGVTNVNAQPTWKIPLEGGHSYLIYTLYDGYYINCGNDSDQYHTDANNGYYAIDFHSPADNPNAYIVAAFQGNVTKIYSDPLSGYGYGVRLNHGDGYESVYGHFKEIPLVNVGDSVIQGQKLGIIGSTGFSTGRHLHFAVYYHGNCKSNILESRPEPISGYTNLQLGKSYFSDNYGKYTCHLPNGLYVVGRGGGTYYYIQDGKKRPINGGYLAGRKISSDRVITLSDDSLNSIPTGANVGNYQELKGFKFSNSSYYYLVIKDSERKTTAYMTKSRAVFASWGIKDSEIVTNPLDPEAYITKTINSTSNPLYFRPGFPVKCPLGIKGYSPSTVFVPDLNYQYRPIFDEKTYFAIYPSWDWVIEESDPALFLSGFKACGQIIKYEDITCDGSVSSAGMDRESDTTTTILSYISPSAGAHSDDGYPITLEVPTDIVTYTEPTRITVKCASVLGADGYQLMGANGYVYGGVRGTCNINATRLLPLTTYELLLRATVHNPATDLVIGVSDWVHIIETTEAEKTTTTIPITTTTTTAPATTTTTSIPQSSSPSGNLLINGGFENSSVYPWVLEDHNSTGSIYVQSSGSAEGRNCLVVTNKLAQEEWKVQLKQTISVKAGVQYYIVLWIKAESERYIYLDSGQEYSPWGNNGLWQPIVATTEWVKYTIPFTAAFTETYNRISLMVGNDTPEIYIDGFAILEASLQQGTAINLLQNGGFELGNSPWLEEDHNNTANFQVISAGAYTGSFCAKITNSTVNQFYQVQFKQVNLSLTQNQPYTVSFYAKAEKPRTVYVHVCKEQANWDSAGLWQEINLTTNWQKFEFSFVSLLTESNARFTIMMGHDTPAVYLDEMALHAH